MSKKDFNENEKEKISTVKSITFLVIIGIAIYVWASKAINKKSLKECKKVKIVKHIYKIHGGIYQEVCHRIWLKNTTGVNIKYVDLEVTYLDKKGKEFDNKEESFSGTDFGRSKIFRKNRIVKLKWGLWRKNAYIGKDTADWGKVSCTFLGDSIKKLRKVKVKVVNYTEI